MARSHLGISRARIIELEVERPLAARTVVEYLAELEDQYEGDKPERLQQKYCKAYHFRDLRAYQGWSERRISRSGTTETANSGKDCAPPADDRIVFAARGQTRGVNRCGSDRGSDP